MQNAQLNALRLPSLRSLKFHRPDTADTQSSSPTVAASHQQPWPRAHDTPDDASRVALERYEPPPAYYESAPTLVPAVVNQGDGQVWPQRTSNQDTSYGPERPRTMQRDAEACGYIVRDSRHFPHHACSLPGTLQIRAKRASERIQPARKRSA